jgi:methionyl-tRNA synthetase
MSADVMRRFARLQGREALFVTGTDDSQTYVVATARKRQTTPQALCARSTEQIRRSLEASLIDVDGFAPFDAGYERTVRAFLDPLREAGKFALRTRRLPYDPASGRFLVEGLVAGECPHCLAESRGALCEACGLPLACEDLRHMRSTLDPTAKLETREATILVFPLEQVRHGLEAYYDEARLGELRPASARIIRRMLAGPLPEFPITYPLDWGIAAEWEEVPGQVLNAWAEGMAASMYCTAAAGAGTPEEGMAAWTSRTTDLVYFLGIDNVYFWGMSHLGLLLAHEGRYMVPRNYYSNHFYELADEKISTSRGHVLSMDDLLETYDPEAIRFYLCWTAPETTERSFSHEALRTIVTQQLVTPWNLVHEAAFGAGAPPDGPAEAEDVLAVETMRTEMAGCLAPPAFSLNAAARIVSKHLHRLAGYVRSGDAPRREVRAQFVELARLADPILKQAADVDEVADPAWRPRPIALRRAPAEARTPPLAVLEAAS